MWRMKEWKYILVFLIALQPPVSQLFCWVNRTYLQSSSLFLQVTLSSCRIQVQLYQLNLRSSWSVSEVLLKTHP